MSHYDRAKQFAPFDALKGLKEALKMKEYQHDRQQKGDIPEEQIAIISSVLLKVEKKDIVRLFYFSDGYNKRIEGKAEIDIIQQNIKIDSEKISFEDILDIKILKTAKAEKKEK